MGADAKGGEVDGARERENRRFRTTMYKTIVLSRELLHICYFNENCLNNPLIILLENCFLQLGQEFSGSGLLL